MAKDQATLNLTEDQVPLNLRMPRGRADMAKKMAREMNTSVSSLVSEFFAGMARIRQEPGTLAPLLTRLAGSIPEQSVPPGDLLMEALEEKYGAGT